MNAHRVSLSSAPALIEMASRVIGRISRLAIYATPDMRLRLMGDLALTETLLDGLEQHIANVARTTLRAMPKPRALPPGREKARAR